MHLVGGDTHATLLLVGRETHRRGVVVTANHKPVNFMRTGVLLFEPFVTFGIPI
jgi:hypothetical protein